MKKIIPFFLLAFCAFARPTHAQQFELLCPAGTTVLNTAEGTTVNSISGKLRQNLCIDSSGNIINNTTSSISNLGGILVVDGIKYPTLASAITALPSSGGSIFDCFPETFTSDPFVSVTKPFHVFFCGNNLQVTGGWITNVPLAMRHNGQILTGAGPNNFTLTASPTFPTSSTIISLGAPFPGVYGTRIEEMAISCGPAPVAGCTGVGLDGVEEESGMEDLNVVNCTAACYRISSDQGAGATQNPRTFNNIRGTMLQSGTNVSCVNPVIEVANTTSFRIEIHNGTETGVVGGCSGGTVFTPAGLEMDAPVEVNVNNLHAEAVTSVVLMSTTATVQLSQLIGHSTVTHVVTSTAAGGNYTLQSITSNGVTGNTLNDTGNSIIIPGIDNINFCARTGVTTPFQFCSDVNVPWIQTVNNTASPAFTQQLQAGFTGSNPDILLQAPGAIVQFEVTKDGRILFRGNQTGAFTQNMSSDTLTASRVPQFPNGNSATVMVAALVTTAAATDNVTVQGMTASGHCSLTATNAAAAAATLPSVTTKAANQITVTHAVTANMNYDVMCTSN